MTESCFWVTIISIFDVPKEGWILTFWISLTPLTWYICNWSITWSKTILYLVLSSGVSFHNFSLDDIRPTEHKSVLFEIELLQSPLSQNVFVCSHSINSITCNLFFPSVQRKSEHVHCLIVSLVKHRGFIKPVHQWRLGKIFFFLRGVWGFFLITFWIS